MPPLTPDQFPAPKIEKTKGEYWAGLLNDKGKGWLSAKFKSGWLINGQPINVVDGAFEFIGDFGYKPKHDRASYYLPSGVISSFIYSGSNLSESDRKSSNYFVTCPVEPENTILRDLKLGGNWTSATYLAWEDKDIPDIDSRGHHLPLAFTFMLPAAMMGYLLAEVKSNPDLIEDIFQQMYPGLTVSNQLVRTKTAELRVIEIGSGTNIREYSTKQGLVKNATKYSFSRQVGEA